MLKGVVFTLLYIPMLLVCVLGLLAAALERAIDELYSALLPLWAWSIGED